MAYAAIVCVEQILDQLLHSNQFPLHSLQPELESFYHKIRSLQLSLQKIYPVRKSRSEVNDLEIQIRDAIYKAQDTIEAYISQQTLPSEIPEDQSYASVFLQDLQKLAVDIHPIAERAKDIAGPIQEDSLRGDLLPGDTPNSRSNRISRSTKIVGQDKDWKKLRDGLLEETAERRVIQITGLPGIGKTTLAQSIYDDRRIVDEFSIRSWVTVGEEYLIGEIFLKLLGTIETKGQRSDVSGTMNKLRNEANQGSAEQIAVQLHTRLFDTRYLVVLDDVWDIAVWDKINNYLPDNMNGSRIILTTRSEMVARKVNPALSHELQRLDSETSWRLLCEKVFGGGYCPPQFETMGKEIAKHCHGLPLSITVVGGQLSQERENARYWKIVEEDVKAAAASEKETYIEILSRSYDQLPGRLKGCFLYMGAFPEDSEIFASKLIKLWICEGFLTPSDKHFGLEQVAEQYLNELVDRNLILVRKFSSDGRIRTCGMHDSLRYLAETKSQDESFFHDIKRYPRQNNLSRNRELQKEGSGTVKGKGTDQRRISVHKNMLMCMKDVYKSTKSMKFARTLLYAGPYHHHPLPLCLTFDFLRVLDALTVFFIEFPNELVKLVHLRYLSLTYNGKLPPSISQLQNLLILIVRRHPKIIIMGNPILPEEIWSMPHLRHVLLTDSDFPDLPNIRAQNSVLLKNLQSLSNINGACCSKEVLQNMPNLKKLGIWIIEAPGEVELHLDQLKHLEAFKFTILNPIPGEKIVIKPKLVFPTTLRKLSLSGCGLPWEDMTIIGQLPSLQVLKLREFAFEGPEWCPLENDFENLKFLLLESLNLKVWQANHLHFPSLDCLIIRQCYELEDMDPDIGNIGTLKLIELVGCSPRAVEWAEEIREDLEDYGNKLLQVRIYS